MKINISEGMKRIVLITSIFAFIVSCFMFLPEPIRALSNYKEKKSVYNSSKFIPTKELMNLKELKPWEQYDLKERTSSKLCTAEDSIQNLLFAFTFDSTLDLSEGFIQNKLDSKNYIDIGKNRLFNKLPIDSQKELLFKLSWENSRSKIAKELDCDQKFVFWLFLKSFLLILIITVIPWILNFITQFIIKGFLKNS
jgi:hypothetical protein